MWLTPTIDESLWRFEKALRTIGSAAWVLEQVPGSTAGLGEMYATFAKILGFEKWDGESLTDELTVTAVINQLRRVLGTEELNRLRSELVTRALRNIENSA